MIPTSFECFRPDNLNQALELIGKYKDEAKVLSGGQSLIPMMKLRFARYPVIIDIGKLEELRFIKEEDGKIKIGALTKHREVEKSELIKSKIPVLSFCASEIADIQVRNMGTIGGSLAHADPSADFPPVILVLDAEITAKSIDNERKIGIGELFKGVFETVLEENELLTEIHIPIPPENMKFSYKKLPHPATGFAVVNCALGLKMNGDFVEDIRVAFGGMVTSPYRDKELENLLKGRELTQEVIEEASSKIGENQDIISDYYADAEYRKNVARVFFKKALSEIRGN